MNNNLVDLHLQQETEKKTKEFIELAKLFARKSRRPWNQLTSLDLINAMASMEISTHLVKRIYYLRHFQALHNIQPYNYELHDPRLSSLGESQAAKTNALLLTLPKIELIVCSPLTRTLQTYLLTYYHLVQSSKLPAVPLIIHPDVQEICHNPCDVGRPIEELKRDFPMFNEELERFRTTFGDEEWRIKDRPESFYHPDRIEERARRIRQWLIDRPEQTILVISHHLMIQHLFKLDGERVDLENGEIKLKEYSS